MNDPESLQEMSKKLDKRATRLVRKAEDRALAIRRVVQEYKETVRRSAVTDSVRPTENHHEIERAVVKYNEVHKALKRLRKKIESKGKDTSGPAVRSFEGR
jgi:2-C-methyl-D-erythritol 4-phosphate cytidylyltransferase